MATDVVRSARSDAGRRMRELDGVSASESAGAYQRIRVSRGLPAHPSQPGLTSASESAGDAADSDALVRFRTRADWEAMLLLLYPGPTGKRAADSDSNIHCEDGGGAGRARLQRHRGAEGRPATHTPSHTSLRVTRHSESHVTPSRKPPLHARETAEDTEDTGDDRREYRVSESRVSESRVSESRVSESRVSESRVSESRVSESRVSESRVSESRVSESRVSESRVSESHVEGTRAEQNDELGSV